MKLELKHLAPYLPYGLKMAHFDSQFKIGHEVHTLNGLSENYRYKKDDLNDDDDLELLNIKEITFWFNRSGLNSTTHNVKPILRPLSDLTKEIKYKLSTYAFTDLFEIGDCDGCVFEFGHGNVTIIKALEDIAKYNLYNDINYLPYAVVDMMLKWHFDIFGLIDHGLAIDINTI